MNPAPTDRRLSLAQQLVQDLSRQILAGELPPGSKLPTEQVIIKARGVSRTVVREAMSRLQAEGLVETRHGIGTFVVDTTRPGDFQGARQVKGGAFDPLAVIELRLSLEVEAAAIAAQRRSAAQLQALRAALDAAGASPAPDAGLEFEFHLLIAQCTGNSFFIDAMSHLRTTLVLTAQPQSAPDSAMHVRAAAHPAAAPHVPTLPSPTREREQIYHAIAQRDADVARAAMRLHLINALQTARAAAPRD